VKRERPSLHAALTEGRPETLEDDTLVIKFGQGQDFHVTQLTRPDNAGFLRDSLRQITGRDLNVTGRVAGSTTDEPAPEEGAPAILTPEEVVHLMKELFEARPIEGDPTS
jgi:hypothetical protein